MTRSLNVMTVRSSAISLGRGLILGGGTEEVPGLVPRLIQVRMGPTYKRVRLVRGEVHFYNEKSDLLGGIIPINSNQLI